MSLMREIWPKDGMKSRRHSLMQGGWVLWLDVLLRRRKHSLMQGGWVSWLDVLSKSRRYSLRQGVGSHGKTLGLKAKVLVLVKYCVM